MKISFLLIFFLVACHQAPDNIFHTESLRLDKKISNGQTKYFRSLYNLGGIYSKEYYEIKAQLFLDSSFLELFSHSKDIYFANGIAVRIERDQQDLHVKVKVQSWPYKSLLVRKDYFLNQSEIDWTLEVHNGTYEGFRIRVWENFINIKNVNKLDTQYLSSRNLVIDSLTAGLTFVETEYGLKWGLKSYKAEVFSAKRIFNKSL